MTDAASTFAPTKTLLGLPVQHRRLTLASAIALALYNLMTMQRGMSMYDSPELAMVAEQLGLGHPIGQPLHTLLGWVATRLPIDPLFALNALSAIAGALTVIAATSLGHALLRTRDQGPDCDGRVVPVAVAFAGVHPALWEPATRIEVYPLATLACMWAAARLAHAMITQQRGRAPYFVVGVALGIAASVNPFCAIGTAFAITPRLCIALFRKEVPWKSLASVVPGGLLGLVPYLYVPLVAQRSGVVLWGKPNTLDALRRYWTGAEYAGARSIDLATFANQFADLVVWANRQGIVALLLMGFIGYALYSRRRGLGRIFYTFNLIYFYSLMAANKVFAPDVLDYLGYLAIPNWVGATGVGLLAGAAFQRGRAMRWGVLVAIGCLLALSPPPPWTRTRHKDRVTDSLAQQALQSVPQRAIVVVESDHWAAPLWYLQEQRAERPDVVLVLYGLTGSSWYWDHLYERHPELHPFGRRGPGGRPARLRRFVAAQGDRPLRVERVTIAQALQRPICEAPWLVALAPSCPDRSAASDEMTDWITRTAATLGHGSPGTAGLLASLAQTHGHNLLMLGKVRGAVRALLAPMGNDSRGFQSSLDALPVQSDKPPIAPPEYEPAVALGHRARNLHYAAMVAHWHGAIELAEQLAERAAAEGPVSPKFVGEPDATGSL